MQTVLKQDRNMLWVPGEKKNIQWELSCPAESCPAACSILGQVTVNDSDDSSHLSEILGLDVRFGAI